MVHLPPYSLVRECIHWVPPVDGHICLEVTLDTPGYAPQRSQRNIDVYEPLVPGEVDSLPFLVGNPFEEPMTITFGLIPHVEEPWTLRADLPADCQRLVRQEGGDPDGTPDGCADDRQRPGGRLTRFDPNRDHSGPNLNLGPSRRGAAPGEQRHFAGHAGGR